MSDSLRPHELQHARPPCPSPTPGVHPDSHPSSQRCRPAISSSVVPFSSCPQSLPASGCFPMSQLFAWGGQSIGVSHLLIPGLRIKTVSLPFQSVYLLFLFLALLLGFPVWCWIDRKARVPSHKRCDNVIYNKKYIFGHLHFWHRNFLSDKSTQVSFVILMRWLLYPTWGWGLVARGANREIRESEFYFHTLWPLKRRSWRLNQSQMASYLISHAHDYIHYMWLHSLHAHSLQWILH